MNIRRSNGPISADSLKGLDVQRDVSVRFFWWFVFSHLLVWLGVCCITQPNMPLDMIEMLSWGQQWEMGYYKHPPLPAWIAAAVWEVSGGQSWAMYIVSQLTIVATFWAVWQLGRELMTPWLAICCVVVLEGCYYCNFMINDINNTIMTRPMWALAILFMYRALFRQSESKRIIYWCMTGLVIGLGMLCKYYMAVLVIAFMVIPVVVPQTRRALKTPGPYLMTAIALAIFAPHAIWMFENDFITIRYILMRSSDAAAQAGDSWFKHLTSPVSFLLSQAGAVVPVVILAWPLIQGLRRRSREMLDGSIELSAQRYLQVVVLGPVLIYLLVATLMGVSIRSMWGGPLFSFLGVLLLTSFQVASQELNIRKVIRSSLIMGVVMAMGLLVRNGAGPHVRGELSKVHFPGQQVAEQINQQWKDRFGSDLEIVGGQIFVAGCVGVYSERPLLIYGGMSPIGNPWVSDQELLEKGGMIVWDCSDFGEKPPADWLQRFENAEQLAPLVCNSQSLTSNLPAKVGVLMVPPGDSPESRVVQQNSDKTFQR